MDPGKVYFSFKAGGDASSETARQAIWELI